MIQVYGERGLVIPAEGAGRVPDVTKWILQVAEAGHARAAQQSAVFDTLVGASPIYLVFD
jgi:hypothetical protein